MRIFFDLLYKRALCTMTFGTQKSFIGFDVQKLHCLFWIYTAFWFQTDEYISTKWLQGYGLAIGSFLTSTVFTYLLQIHCNFTEFWLMVICVWTGNFFQAGCKKKINHLIPLLPLSACTWVFSPSRTCTWMEHQVSKIIRQTQLNGLLKS